MIREARADEPTLVAGVLAGDEASFRALYHLHTPVLFRVAARRLGSVADAEEVVQESWLRAARGLHRFAWRSSLRTWLVGIVIHCCRERDRARPAAAALPEQLSASGSPAEAHAAAVDLERAVAALPTGAREVLLLHDVEGYTHGEVAALLGIEEGTSKSQLHHARRALAAQLGRPFAGGRR